jgi:P-type conjugative transfer protein TrbL
MNIVTQASESYMTTFHGFVTQFTEWGQWIFISLVTINVVWMCLWYAFDHHSFSESMSSFIKKFFSIAFFYTIMMNSSWLMDVLKTAQFMGETLTHAPIDPSSLISQGIGLGNKVIEPIKESSLLTAGFSLIMLSLVYIIILFVFISIALDLAVTLIITTALISIASFFLGFAALGATSQIARQTLDVILGNCVKLLAIYLVVAAGSQTITMIAGYIPTTTDQLKESGFDFYAWIVAASVLFWLIAKNLPAQLARMITGAIQETRGVDAAALGMAAVNYAQIALPPIHTASNAISGVAKIAGSTGYNAAAHFGHGIKTGSVANGLGSAVSGSTAHLGKAVAGNIADHFKDIASKLAGGLGSQQPITGVSERMYQAAKDINSKMSSSSESGLIKNGHPKIREK